MLPDPSNLSYLAQLAINIMNQLPSKFEGMSGTFMGKDFSGLAFLFDIYEIEDNEEKREVFDYIIAAIDELGKQYENQKKIQNRIMETQGRNK